MEESDRLQNYNPTIHEALKERELLEEELDNDVSDPIDCREIFDHLRIIKDPEHPLSLEMLNVVEQSHVNVDNDANVVNVEFTPTIPHCSMATLIGLSIRVKLLRVLPSRFKVTVSITPGTHVSEDAINKQLADKERIAAALENNHLLEVLNQCLTTELALPPNILNYKNGK